MLSGECETPANRAIKQEKSITRLPVYTLDPVYLLVLYEPDRGQTVHITSKRAYNPIATATNSDTFQFTREAGKMCINRYR
ncbi:hypothetical protein DPMN_137803 [Dreissena polymorpha]|uniref:Uncharacterized protein n=1 Tax=Dreissena polymorpha TaxID=45954 RepID=A0A9D4JGQ4_DREPO|nr:hypothetical protein DPMN_137803 [Dreissena polymorpha]